MKNVIDSQQHRPFSSSSLTTPKLFISTMHSPMLITSILAVFAGIGAATAIEARQGAPGPFVCQTIIGQVPAPACCKNVTPTDNDGSVDVSDCYIDVRTINTYEGDW